MPTKKKKKPAASRGAKGKPARKAKRAAPRRKPAARRKKAVARRRPAARSRPARKAAARPAKTKAASRKAKRRAPVRPRKGTAGFDVETPLDARGLGAEAGGQSGDTEGLSRAELADSESVEELLEEGQAFEAGIVSGVENAPDADEGEVTTREVPEDDVPQEYLDED